MLQNNWIQFYLFLQNNTIQFYPFAPFPYQDVQVKQDINLFVFTDWPKDAAVPAASESLYRLIKEVDKVNHQDQKQKTIIVCCK